MKGSNAGQRPDNFGLSVRVILNPGGFDLRDALRVASTLAGLKRWPANRRSRRLLGLRKCAEQRSWRHETSQENMTHDSYALSSEGSAGFSSGSTRTSRTAVRGERRVDRMAAATSPGCVHLNPSASQALAKAAKSIGANSQP
jgi:hypothetical protein